MSHFGKPAQPFSTEAKQYLQDYILHHSVKVKLLRKDQYDRLVGMVFVRKFKLGFIPVWENVSTEMLKRGLACLYEGASAEYDDYYSDFLKNQQVAQQWKRGIWSLSNFQSPGDYKKQYK